MAQYQEGQTATGPDGSKLVYSGGKWRPQGAASVPGIQIKPADPKIPLQVEKLRQDIAQGQTAASTAAARTPLDIENQRLQNEKLRRDLAAKPEDGLTAEARGKLQAQRGGLTGLAGRLQEVRGRYDRDFKGGGLGALSEYAPGFIRPENQAFNDAGKSLMGDLAATYGLSAQQQNTPAEIALRFGPFVPKASDPDSVIESKIARIEDIVNTQGGVVAGQLGDKELQAELARLLASGDRQAVDQFMAAQRIRPEDPKQVDAAIAAGGGIVPPPKPAPPSGPSAGGAFGYGLGDMFSLGMLDEAGAAVDSLIPTEGRPNIWQSGVGIRDAFSSNLDANRAILGQAQEQQPGAFLGGQVVGGIAGAGGLAKGAASLLGRVAPGMMGGGRVAAAGRMAAGESAFGAGYGAGSSVEGQRGRGALTGSIAAPAGGIAGRAAVGAAGRALSPVVDPAVRRLADAGITMTPGQIMGGVARWTEDKAMSLPIVGDAIRSARQRQVPQFQRGAINEALKPLGKTIPKELAGNEAVEHAQEIVSRAYDEALLPLRAAPDEALQLGINAIGDKAASLPKAQQELYASIIEKDFAPFLPEDGVFTGKQIQSIKRGLDKRISGLSKSSPADQMLADTLGEIRAEVMDFSGRVAPAEAQGFRAANEAFARLSRINSAAANATDGMFTPNQLRTAVRQGDRSSNKRQTAAGNALLQDYVTDASNVLPSSIPNSGSFDRAALGAMAVGGGAMMSPPGLAAYSATSLPYLPGLDRATQKLLIDRPELFLQTGDALRKRAYIGGMFGAPLAVQGAQ
jgi:hypothetical protein